MSKAFRQTLFKTHRDRAAIEAEMQRANIRELADAMTRHYGKPKVLTLATQYASNAAALDDHQSRIRWSRVAAVLGESLPLEQRCASR